MFFFLGGEGGAPFSSVVAPETPVPREPGCPPSSFSTATLKRVQGFRA